MALFTHVDHLEDKTFTHLCGTAPNCSVSSKPSVEDSMCFNNEEQNPEQVIWLFEQIDKIVTGNGGQYYTNKMFNIK